MENEKKEVAFDAIAYALMEERKRGRDRMAALKKDYADVIAFRNRCDELDQEWAKLLLIQDSINEALSAAKLEH